MSLSIDDSTLLRTLVNNTISLPEEFKIRLLRIADNLNKPQQSIAISTDALSAASDFLRWDSDKIELGLHRIRVNGDLLTRAELADVLAVAVITEKSKRAISSPNSTQG